MRKQGKKSATFRNSIFTPLQKKLAWRLDLCCHQETQKDSSFIVSQAENVQNRGSRWLIIEHTFFLNIHQIIPLILQDWIVVSVWPNIAVPLGLSHSLSQMRLSCRWHIVQKGKSSAMCGTFLLWCIVLLSVYQSVAKYILGLLYADNISCRRLHHNFCTQGFIRLVSPRYPSKLKKKHILIFFRIIL